MSKSTKFEEGEIVFHKSNPIFKLVVNYVEEKKEDDDQKYECTWLDAVGVMHCEVFLEFELEKSITL